MERRERDKLARAMMSQTQNEEPEPLFSAPVRVSEFVDFIDDFCCASSLARRKYEIAILIIVAVRFCSQSDGTFPFFVVKTKKWFNIIYCNRIKHTKRPTEWFINNFARSLTHANGPMARCAEWETNVVRRAPFLFNGNGVNFFARRITRTHTNRPKPNRSK